VIENEIVRGTVSIDEHTLKVLELPQLLVQIASLASSSVGADFTRHLSPSVNLVDGKRRQRRLTQLRVLIAERGRPDLSGLIDLRQLFFRLNMDGSYLLLEEIIFVINFLDATTRAVKFLDGNEGRFDELFYLKSSLTHLPDVAFYLKQIVGTENFVASSASIELSRLRREQNITRENLRKRLNNLLNRDDLTEVFSDRIITQRVNRFVVPIRADAKKKLTGIIHDTSSSGFTYFIEPLEVISSNNKLALLCKQEREEEERILAKASRMLAVHQQKLQENLKVLIKLDSLLAQAEFCERLQCVEAVLNSVGQIEFLAARHPLLAWRSVQGCGEVVPINICLGGGQQVLVISGANAGGKTAILKTVGLITLMVMCGLHASCLQQSRVALFSQILAEIGDDQSFDHNLSTFTAHAGRLSWMVQEAKIDSLVIIDEIGNGTDPGEGAALAIAVLDWLKKNKAKVFCTTHYHRLKAYAARAEGVENVSVAFSPISENPIFQPVYGLAGFSDALIICRSLAFPSALIKDAENQVDQSEAQTLAFMRQVRNMLDETQTVCVAAKVDRIVAIAEREQIQIMLKVVRRKQTGIMLDGKHRVREVALHMEKRLENLFERASYMQHEININNYINKVKRDVVLRPGKIRQEFYAERKKALRKVEATALSRSQLTDSKIYSTALNELYILKAGDLVELINLGGQQGILLENPHPKLEKLSVSVGSGGVRVMVSMNELRPLFKDGFIKQKHKKSSSSFSIQTNMSDSFKLNIIGITINDALSKIDEALEQAFLARKTYLKVYGVTTSQLCTAVCNFLDTHSYVLNTHCSVKKYLGAKSIVADLKKSDG